MESIKFDFRNGKAIIENEGETEILDIPELENKRKEILSAAGIESIPLSELRNELNDFFEENGLDLRCAEPTDNI